MRGRARAERSRRKSCPGSAKKTIKVSFFLISSVVDILHKKTNGVLILSYLIPCPHPACFKDTKYTKYRTLLERQENNQHMYIVHSVAIVQLS